MLCNLLHRSWKKFVRFSYIEFFIMCVTLNKVTDVCVCVCVCVCKVMILG